MKTYHFHELFWVYHVHIKHKTFFKDIISFEGNKCIFGGVGFTKINDIWITDDKH